MHDESDCPLCARYFEVIVGHLAAIRAEIRPSTDRVVEAVRAGPKDGASSRPGAGARETMTTREVADLAGRKAPTVTGWVRAGKLKGFKPSGDEHGPWAYVRREVEEFLKLR